MPQDDAWTRDLHPASIGGVEVPVMRRRIRGGRDGAHKQLPFVPGQETEPTGRRPRAFSLTIELFEGMFEADLYPDRYEDLLAVLQDDTNEGVVEYFDPVFGPLDVFISDWDVVEEAERRVGATVTLELMEEGFLDASDPFASQTGIASSTRGNTNTNATALDVALEDAGVGDAEILQAWEDSGFPAVGPELQLSGNHFESDVGAFFKTIDEGIQRVDEVLAQAERVRARTQGVITLLQSRVTSSWPIIEKAYLLIDGVASAGERDIGKAGLVLDFEVKAPLSTFEIANQLYGSVDRATDLFQRNPTSAPLRIPVGTILRVPEF